MSGDAQAAVSERANHIALKALSAGCVEWVCTFPVDTFHARPSLTHL